MVFANPVNYMGYAARLCRMAQGHAIGVLCTGEAVPFSNRMYTLGLSRWLRGYHIPKSGCRRSLLRRSIQIGASTRARLLDAEYAAARLPNLAHMFGTFSRNTKTTGLLKELHQACDRTEQDEKVQNWVGGVSDETGEYGD